MHGYRGSCACGKALARVDTGRCDMCSAIPRQLQWRDRRYQPLASRCSGCGIRLTIPRSHIRGYCGECALISGIPDPNADNDLTEEQAIANVLRVTPSAQIVDDASQTAEPVLLTRSLVTATSTESNDAYIAGRVRRLSDSTALKGGRAAEDLHADESRSPHRSKSLIERNTTQVGGRHGRQPNKPKRGA